MFLKKIFSLALVAGTISQSAWSQTLKTLSDCERSFQKNNLQLLAAAYDIDQAKAGVIQARIWDQPYLSGEINAYNPQGSRYLDVGKSGQKAVALNQLIYLGGKKSNEIAFAKSNQQLAELQFTQLLSTLKQSLRQGFYSLYFHQQNVARLEMQVSNLDTLVAAYELQAQKQNVSLRELVRLQSLALQFKKDLLDLRQQMNEEQARLQLLTGDSLAITPQIENIQLEQRLGMRILQSESDLYGAALQNNPEYRYTQALSENSALLLRWQKSLAVPDITLGGSYDQRGGAFNNQVNLTLGMPLPLWNRNRGNIKSAQAGLAQSKLNIDYKAGELRTDVHIEFTALQQLQKEYSGFTTSGNSNYIKVYEGMLQNFRKRNISLLDFTDFMESYNQSLLSVSEIQVRIIRAQESLNYLTGTTIFE